MYTENDTEYDKTFKLIQNTLTIHKYILTNTIFSNIFEKFKNTYFRKSSIQKDQRFTLAFMALLIFCIFEVPKKQHPWNEPYKWLQNESRNLKIGALDSQKSEQNAIINRCDNSHRKK